MQILNRVLIFDDDVHIAEIVTCMLDQNEWEVLTFCDCKDIVARVTKIKPSVIIMDNRIPESGGIIATNLLKATDQLQSIPVIYLTADSAVQKLADEAKADAYLPKPFDIDQLQDLIQSFVPQNR